MRVAIPHNLDNDTVRERLKSRSHEIANHIPGNATVRTMWPSENRMTGRGHVASPPHRRKVHGIVQNAPRNAVARSAFD